MNLINDCNLPKPVLDAFEINSTMYNPGKTDYSPSNIMLGAKEYWYKKRSKLTSRKVSDGWSAFIGTLIHIGFEYLLKKYTGPGSYKLEQHLELEMYGKIVGGTIDGAYYNPDGNITIFDYKTLQGKQFIDEDKIKEWTVKANMYKYLIKKIKNITVTNLIYIGVWRDWKKSAYLDNQELIPTQAVVLDVWSHQETEEYIKTRIEYFEQYKDSPIDSIPYCRNVERWNKKREWKVGKVVAGKVPKGLPKMSYDSLLKAEIAMGERSMSKPKETLGIKVVGGDSPKCRNYCDYRHLCPFLSEHPDGELEDGEE